MAEISGHLAAITAAACWTVSATAFSMAGRRIGSVPVNILRFALAWPAVLCVHGALYGSWLPFGAPAWAWRDLLASGFVGYFLGDLCLFRAFVDIGPRRSLLIMSLVPPLTALMETIALHQHLTVRHWMAMGVTVAGIAMVVASRTERQNVPNQCVRGYLLAFGGAVAQATAMVLARHGVPALPGAWSASALRITSGALCFGVLAVLREDPQRLRRAIADRTAMVAVLLGALAGPLVGVTLVLHALARIPAGIAQTLTSTSPVLILPVSHWIDREQIGVRAIVGALIACTGVALLLWIR